MGFEEVFTVVSVLRAVAALLVVVVLAVVDFLVVVAFLAPVVFLVFPAFLVVLWLLERVTGLEACGSGCCESSCEDCEVDCALFWEALLILIDLV